MPQPDAPTFYVTTPIYYVNDRPHIGHVYTTTVADVLARYHRLRGADVFFLTGVDEHAAKVVEAAEQRGITPLQWADQNAAAFRDTFAKLGITNTDFVRTSEDRHKGKVTQYVTALLASGDVYAGEYEGWYDAGQEEYVTDAKAAEYDYKSPINGKPLVRKREKNYFFRLEKYRDAVAAAIRDDTLKVRPEARRNEVLNRLADARDVPISRTGSGGWGIPMPTDPQQTIYVWIDALFNYLTYVDTNDRRKYWTSGATHLIAKDILWFHAAVWPAVLLALSKCPGYDWVRLPAGVYAHSFWISEGQKMSKSLGNFVDLEKIDSYVERFSLDALRYFLATQGPLGTTDADFAEQKFIETYNTDLANKLGNSFSRVCNMIGRYFGGSMPASGEVHVPLTAKFADGEVLTAQAFDWNAIIDKTLKNYEAGFSGLESDVVVVALKLVSEVDDFIETTAPFKLAKDPAKLPEVGAILYNCAEALRIASVLLWPVIPGKCEEMWRRLGLDYAGALRAGRGDLEAWCAWGQLREGTPIEKGDALFPRWQA